MSPPKTERLPATDPPGANTASPPQTMTLPDTGAAIRTEERTATTLPSTGSETARSRPTEVCEAIPRGREAGAAGTEAREETEAVRTSAAIIRGGRRARARGAARTPPERGR